MYDASDDTLPSNPGRLLEGGPDFNIGGQVCVMSFFDDVGLLRFNVNHFSFNGTGWTSDMTYSREEADMAAEILAIKCAAELVDCDCWEEKA